jgi:uncharacterized protein involved in outer membrane biogenesis
MRRSFKYVLAGLPVVAVVVAGAVSILLPQMVASRLAERVEARHGLTMTVEGGSGLSFTDGLAVRLDNVTFTRSSQQGVPVVSVGEIRVDSPLAQALGSGLRRVTLIDPVFTFIASGTKNLADGAESASAKTSVRPLDITIENGAIKASDPQHNLAFAITDISGSLTQSDAGVLEGQLRGLFNGVSTELVLSVDDVRRLQQRGSPSDVTLSSKAGQLVMSGRLRLTGAVQFDGSLSAEAADAQSFLSWMGVPLAGLADGIPLALDAGVSIAHANARFRNLAFALGDMQAKGDVSVQAAAPRPAIKAELAFTQVNLNIYGAAGPGGQPSPPDLTRSWRETGLPFADLKAVDADIALTTDSLMAGAVSAGPSSLTATLKDGVLQSRLETQALFGGRGAFDVSLSHAEQTQMKLALDVAGVAAKEFLGKAFGITFLSGPLDLKTDLTAKGSSPAQLISTLAGTASLSLSNGQIDGLDLARLAGVVSADDAEGWGLGNGEATALATATASAVFADGIATLRDTRLQSSGFSADVSGDVDLLRRAVDLKVSPGKGLPLPVAARVRGPWDRPKLSAKLDVEGALRGDTGDVLDDAADAIAKGAGKSVKKALKKLLDN